MKFVKKSNSHVATIETLLEITERLEARIGELAQRLSKNSSNSSKPPSNDGHYQNHHARRHYEKVVKIKVAASRATRVKR